MKRRRVHNLDSLKASVRRRGRSFRVASRGAMLLLLAIIACSSCRHDRATAPPSPPATVGVEPLPQPQPPPPPPPPAPAPPAGSPGARSARARPPAANTAVVRVFFGTDRNIVSRENARFGDDAADLGDGLTTGWCAVSVPLAAHRIGYIERPTFWTLRVADWYENPDRHFVITERTIADERSFWPALSEVVNRRSGMQVVLFVHGYNVGFDDAVYRAAQLALDLRFQGATALYSWPSNGRVLRYVADKDRSLATVGSFKRFLRDLSQRSGATTINIIAHSMGNNALVHALAELAADPSQPVPHFRQIIMAAPDVDRREFNRLATAFASSADHVTLYAADNDRAIGASDSLHGAPRIGEANPMFLLKGIDSVDASMVIKGFLKHSYFADPRVLDDIERVLGGQGLPRFGLAGVPSDDGAQYWRFRP